MDYGGDTGTDYGGGEADQHSSGPYRKSSYAKGCLASFLNLGISVVMFFGGIALAIWSENAGPLILTLASVPVGLLLEKPFRDWGDS